MIENILNNKALKIDVILKWVATLILIIGTFINAGFPELYPLGPGLLALGGAVWLIVSFMWKEPALIITNGVLTIVGISGIILATL
jgi:hypothetical protein|tara:strand:+ start:912 stop:1169 length:258 start_codon:yes stop_codon:yes gene_type:complete